MSPISPAADDANSRQPPSIASGSEASAALTRLKSWFSDQDLEALARQSGLLRRRARKITPAALLRASLLLVSQSHVCLRTRAIIPGGLQATTVARQSIRERLNERAGAFLELVRARGLGRPMQADPFLLPDGLADFPRVLVQDSPSIALPDRLAAVFPGASNQHGPTGAQMKIQACWDCCAAAVWSIKRCFRAKGKHPCGGWR